VFNLHARFFHQLPRLVAADRVAEGIERMLHTPTAVGILGRPGNILYCFQQFLVIGVGSATTAFAYERKFLL
jgi:hypothetical protein